MKYIKRVLCLILSLLLMIPILSGCSSKKIDAQLYITKGEFFSYFVHENGLTSDLYTSEDIQKSSDGSVEANIIVEWDYLPENLALKDLKNPVEKEIVVMVCANATFDLKKGNVSEIKDADLLEDPQLIADAYASGFFELENGYFDGAEHMSLVACEEIMNKALEYTANFHYEANTEVTETADDVLEQDDSNYSDGDIVLEILSEEIATNIENTKASIYTENDAPQVSFLGVSGQTQNTIQVDNKFNRSLDIKSVKGFMASIKKDTFEKNLKNPNIGDTVIINRGQVIFSSKLNNLNSEMIGVLVEKKLIGDHYECIFNYPEFETAVEKKNVKEGNYSKINKDSFKIEQSECNGWKLEFSVSENSIKINAKKDFTVHETGRKQDWQNSKQTMTASANFEIGDFNIDANNLKSFANKKGKGYIKITYDSNMDFSLSQSLRYTPDSNRNGKFPSNWNNSRWTDSNSKGAKTIKIARFSPSFYGVASADIYIYLQISVDGKISFSTSIADGGVQITANSGKISTQKLGTKKSEADVNVNLHGRLGVDAAFKIFTFINVIEYDVGGDLDVRALVNLYYEDKISKSSVYADEEGLNEYRSDDSKFNYCIGVLVELGVSGQLKNSGVKMILNLISKGETLNFEKSIWSGGFHYEDGAFVDKCTRGNDMGDELKKSKDDEVELEAYKVVIESGNTHTVKLSAIPSKTMNLLDSKNSITVKSNNSKVCIAKYDKANKLIIIDAIGEGSTEIVVKAKKGSLWWKESCEQKISVTVNVSAATNLSDMNYTQFFPQPRYKLQYI